MKITISDLSKTDIARAIDAANASLAVSSPGSRIIRSPENESLLRSADADDCGFVIAQVVELELGISRREVHVSTSHDTAFASALLAGFATVA